MLVVEAEIEAEQIEMGFEEELAEFEPCFVLSKRKRFPKTLLVVKTQKYSSEAVSERFVRIGMDFDFETNLKKILKKKKKKDSGQQIQELEIVFDFDLSAAAAAAVFYWRIRSLFKEEEAWPNFVKKNLKKKKKNEAN